jgi:RimJ/RimL family protein N-acetyltransferase
MRVKNIRVQSRAARPRLLCWDDKSSDGCLIPPLKSLDLQPHLKGKLVELCPLQPGHWDDLFVAASDPLIWELHPESDRYKKEVFRTFFDGAIESGGAFVVLDAKSKRVIGSTRFHGYDPKKSEIEIGWTFLERKYWGGRYNLEMKQLMLAHAFKFVQQVVFYVGQENLRSQKATEKIGAVKSGMREKIYGDRPPSLNFRYVIKKPLEKGAT